MGKRRLSAKEVLARMMHELATNDWPTEATWADACRVLGRKVPRPIQEVAGEPMNALASMNAQPMEFKP